MGEVYKARDSNVKFPYQAHLRKTAGLVPDHHNKVSIAIMHIVMFFSGLAFNLF